MIKSIADLTRTLEGLPTERDLQGWNSDHRIFDDLVAEVKPTTIVEIGTWKGRSAAHFVAATQNANIYCVDTWLGGIDHLLSDDQHSDLLRDNFGSPRLYHQFLKNFANTTEASRIYPVMQTGPAGCRFLAHHGIKAGLIYVDGSHEYADVYADLCAAKEVLTSGGVIFGDDFRQFPGVFGAVIRFGVEHNMSLTEIDNNFWILRPKT